MPPPTMIAPGSTPGVERPILPGRTPGSGIAPGIITSASQKSDVQLVELFTRWKGEAFDQRHIYERQWLRNVWYVLNRQWIQYDSQRGQWTDKRIAKWVPRPVTNICKEAIQAVRANFTAINYGANARPVGDDMVNVVTAGVADKYTPVLHEDHKMAMVMVEFDWWMLTCGNAFLHTCVNYDIGNGVVNIQYETCLQCQGDFGGHEIADAGQKCPMCGGQEFMPTPDPMSETGQKVETRPQPKGITIPLSPFELAFPFVYERFDDSPFVIRQRWRDKSYYEQHPEFASTYAKTLTFSKAPSERSMQIFKSLPFQNDLGMSPAYFGGGGGATGQEAEGITEFDVWIKPCGEFPDGQVVRFAGDRQPVVIHSDLESLPGPIPYHDAKGNPLFTFTHGTYDHVGGRSIGSSLIDPIIQKQDQLNQVDSLMLMIIMRCANPIWLEPKGAEVEKFTGEPGLVVKWNPLVAGGNAKPERIPGDNIPSSLFAYRELIKKEAEELSGTFDILKGERPTGVEAYASLNLLVERGQARHANAFQARGRCYKDWLRFALEIEREFGPDERIKSVMKPTKGWAFERFKKADLGGSIEIIIEDGTLSPKTALGERAAVEHLFQLGMLDPTDQEQKIVILTKFGQTSLMPTLDAQIQEAWMVFDTFEKLLEKSTEDPAIGEQLNTAMMAGATPLKYRRWYNPAIFRQELIKFCVSDRGRELLMKHPDAEPMIEMFLATIGIALQQAQMGILDSDGVPLPPVMGMGGVGPDGSPAGPGGPGGGPGGAPGGQGPGNGPPSPGGAGRSMANSNQNAGGMGRGSSGSGGGKEPLQSAA